LISQKKLLLLVSFSAALWIIYQFIFTLPELIDAWALIQEYSRNQGASQAFSKIFGGFIIQLFFYGSVALWSFNEAFEKEVLTSAMEPSKRSSELAPSKHTNVTFEKGVGQIEYVKIMKPLSIIVLLGSIGIFLWAFYNVLFNPYSFESNFGELIINLFLFAVLGIIGAALWTKSKKGTKMNDKIKPTKIFRQEYEEQKKQEMEDRF
jgi:hypothetical protein